MTATINGLFLAAEAEPYFKVGGLADVAGSLPLALRALPVEAIGEEKFDIRLVLPLHKSILKEPAALSPFIDLFVTRYGEKIPARVFETSLEGMPVYFIEGSPISNASSVYSLDSAQDREKYAFFSSAIIELIIKLDWRTDILHANDWHTSLALHALRSRNDTVFKRIQTIITLHNLPYMGGDGTDVLSAYAMPASIDPELPEWARTQPLPLGLCSADYIIPVSPTYAKEILSPGYSCGLEGYLKKRVSSISGILNGLDADRWDPMRDQNLVTAFSMDDLSARYKNKIKIQRIFGLREDQRQPLMVMVGRIDYQKGLDIAFDTLRQLTHLPWQFIILGSGDTILEETARDLQTEFPERIRAVIRYDASLSHLLYGGADIFLMPSRYEPCGLAQMIAMRYGCVPVVHATGGLKDTVRENKTGFLFNDLTTNSMKEAVERALHLYDFPIGWKIIQKQAMNEDFSWHRSAREYGCKYRSMINSAYSP
jgi:starch synthase